jgi:hypothetical protein
MNISLSQNPAGFGKATVCKIKAYIIPVEKDREQDKRTGIFILQYLV